MKKKKEKSIKGPFHIASAFMARGGARVVFVLMNLAGVLEWLWLEAKPSQKFTQEMALVVTLTGFVL